jgi:hypothetical protein
MRKYIFLFVVIIFSSIFSQNAHAVVYLFGTVGEGGERGGTK